MDPAKNKPLLSAIDAFQYIQPHFDWEQEEVHIIALDSRQSVINHRLMFRGTVDSCLIHPRDIFRYIIQNNASAFIMFHNHPTGILSPSNEDLKFTKKLKQLSRMMEIVFLDHIILTRDGFQSLKERRLL
jgi:DNA repair protein RadC